MKLKTRLLSFLLCILLLTTISCFYANAAVVYVSGDWEYQKINNQTEMEVYAYNGSSSTLSTYYSYNSLLITSIGSRAFEGNMTLNKIALSSAVKSIQSYAFFNATALESVVCTSDVEFIDYSAFNGCISLSSINLVDTKITSVNYATFMNCESLVEVTLPETVTSIAEYAFAYCDSLSKITIPTSVTEINEKAFSNSQNVVIYCYKDSTAHIYAENNSIEYVLIDETPVETYILGDADGDEYVSVLDATTIQLVIASKLEDTDGRISIRGDVNRDETLSVMDATNIQRYLAGNDVEYDIEGVYEY